MDGRAIFVTVAVKTIERCLFLNLWDQGKIDPCLWVRAPKCIQMVGTTFHDVTSSYFISSFRCPLLLFLFLVLTAKCCIYIYSIYSDIWCVIYGALSYEKVG